MPENGLKTFYLERVAGLVDTHAGVTSVQISLQFPDEIELAPDEPGVCLVEAEDGGVHIVGYESIRGGLREWVMSRQAVPAGFGHASAAAEVDLPDSGRLAIVSVRSQDRVSALLRYIREVMRAPLPTGRS